MKESEQVLGFFGINIAMLLHDAAVDGLSGSGVFDNDFAYITGSVPTIHDS